MRMGIVAPAGHPARTAREDWALVEETLTPDVGRVPLDLLVVTPQVDAAAVRRYRLLRPTTRLVAAVTAADAPSDASAALVALGVYDWVPVAALAGVETQPAGTYADAARWAGLEAAAAGEAPAPAVRVVERVVERRVATSARPVLVAVSALAPGAGATAVAAALAAWLAARGHTVAYWSPAGDAPALAAGVAAAGPDDAPDPVRLVQRHVWEYVVADWGTARDTVGGADLRVVVVPGARARAERVWPPAPPPGAAPVAAVLGPGPDGPALAQRWEAAGFGPAFPWPGPRQAARVWAQVLAPVLPDAPPFWRRRWVRRVAAARPAPTPAPAAPTPAGARGDPSAEAPTAVVRLVGPAAPPAAASRHGVRLLAALLDWMFVAAVVAAIVWVGGVAAQAGVLTGPLGTAALRAWSWELAVWARLQGG